ncbi:MAG: hypothetical protein HFF44_01615 [Lawsonibacter sp.]|nr:hypothetical protein [Lawsonibacter sp.]
MLSDEGFRRQANTIFRRNPGCISRKIGEAWGRKIRRLGVLTFFKRAIFAAAISEACFFIRASSKASISAIIASRKTLGDFIPLM